MGENYHRFNLSRKKQENGQRRQKIDEEDVTGRERTR